MARPVLLALSTAPVVLFAVGHAHAQTPLPQDPAAGREPPVREYVVDENLPPSSTRWKLVLGGVATTAAFYAMAQPFSYAWPDAPGGYDLRVPVLGPWMALAETGCAADNPGCSKVWYVTRAILTALDGLGQAGGVAIAFEGVFLPTSDRVAPPSAPGIPHRRSTDPDPQRKAPSEPEKIFLRPTPIPVGQVGIGIGVFGVF